MAETFQLRFLPTEMCRQLVLREKSSTSTSATCQQRVSRGCGHQGEEIEKLVEREVTWEGVTSTLGFPCLPSLH